VRVSRRWQRSWVSRTRPVHQSFCEPRRTRVPHCRG
jgi:hypothetical protein